MNAIRIFAFIFPSQKDQIDQANQAGPEYLPFTNINSENDNWNDSNSTCTTSQKQSTSTKGKVLACIKKQMMENKLLPTS